MNNIPCFTTESGVAGLVLEEIPYRKEAYIKIHSAVEPEKLLADCVGFCRAAGAEYVFATGSEVLSQYPYHTELIRMNCDIHNIPTSSLKLEKVQNDTERQWCDIYNNAMRSVSNASTMTDRKMRSFYEECYFVYDRDQLVGIGKIHEENVDAIVSLVAGRGVEILGALCSIVNGTQVFVEVACDNLRAVNLYRKCGFTRSESLSVWHCVYDRAVSRKNT